MFAFIGNLIGDAVSSIGSMILEAVNGLLGGVVIFLTRIVESLGGFVDILDGFKAGVSGLYTGFLSLISALFPFIPAEWIMILTTCFLMTIVGIIIKKKVFD